MLLIDDERTQRIVLREAMEREGFAVEEAEDGLSGLAAFDRVRPDIVLLDVRMPGMDGFATCLELRRRPTGDRVPVVMLTVLNDATSIDRAYEVGATDFISRPVAWSILGRRLRYMLRASEAFKELAKSEADLVRRVAERTAALDESNRRLEAANRELEAFTYSVSHDLRAPLRAIDGFTEMLSRDLETREKPTALEHLQRIRAAAGRMTHLIDDLLKLASVARQEISRQEVDLSAIAREVTDSLAQADPSRKPQLVVEPGMRANADPRLLRIVLENLIRNAWKFTSRTPEPRIEIGKREGCGAPVYFVRDNGVGFDEQLADKLFAPFQRLHSQDEFEGNGIGLSIVKRIIARHEGRIWAEAQVERGATFFFCLAPSCGQ
ncbi:MAG: response regulator [Betaproteobacteria bacterium]|nr:response regulator [Betaproteobacteria bacterium]